MKPDSHSLLSSLTQQLHKQQFHFFLIAALSLVTLLTNLHKGDLGGFDDAVYAHEAKQMLLTGDWWNVRFNGEPNYEYPPMFIWMEALSLKVFGVSDFAAKLPAVVMGFGTIIFTYFLARELSDDFWLPSWSMLILSSTQFFMKYARHAMTDVPYTFFFVLAIFFYLKALKRPKYFLLCGISVGLAVLMRSVIGLVPLGVIVMHMMVIRRLRLFLSEYFIGGLLLAFVLPLSWYLPQYKAHGEEFLSGHLSFIFNKISSGKSADGIIHRMMSYLMYPLELLKLYWPWLPFMLVGLAMQLNALRRRRDVYAGLLVVWVICVVGPFSLIESKLLRYIMAAFPAFAILSAFPLSKWSLSERKGKWLKLGYLLVCVSLFLAAVFSVPKLRAKDMKKLAPLAESFTPANQRIVLYSYGDPDSSYRNQFLWYANRFCEPLKNIDELRTKLESGAEMVVIVDKIAYAQLGKVGPKIELLGESENFVCFKVKGGSGS